MLKVLVSVLVVTALAGCTHQPVGFFHRVSDGQRVDANPTIAAQFQQDRVICDGEASQAALSSHEKDRYIHSRNVNLVYDACLAKRGYIRK